MRLITACILVVMLWPARSFGEDQVTKEMKRLDLSVSDLPALVAIGLSSDKVTKPSTPRELAVSIANGFSADGTFHDGIAIEVAPIALFTDEGIKDGDLVASLKASLKPLRLSLAATAVANEGTADGKAAVGLRWSYHAYDPTTDDDLHQCLGNALPSSIIDGGGGQSVELPPPGVTPAEDPKVAVALQVCRDRFSAAHLAQSAVEIAGVVDGTAIDSMKINDLGTPRLSVWLAGSYGWNRYKVKEAKLASQKDRSQSDTADDKKLRSKAFGVQPTLMLRFDATDVGEETKTDLFLGVRIPVVWSSFGIFAEYGITAGNLGEVAMTEQTITHRLGAGFDYHVTNGGWLGIYIGDDLGDGASGFSVLSNLKFSYGEDRPYGL